MNDLDKLEVLTEELPTLKDLAIIRNGMTEYEAAEGTILGFGLWKERAIGVQRAFCSKSAVMPRHAHREKEFLIVYKGRMVVDYCGVNVQVGVGDIIVFEPDTAHKVEFLEDTWLIGVTIPLDAGYPDADN